MGEPTPWTGATPLYRGAYRADARALTGGTHGDVVYEKAVPSGCVYELIRPPSWRGSLSWDNKANHRFSFGDGSAYNGASTPVDRWASRTHGQEPPPYIEELIVQIREL